MPPTSTLYHSTILKTTIDDLGNTKIAINSGFKKLFSGNLFKSKSIISDTDIKAFTSAQTAFNKTMRDASEEAQNMAASAKGFAVNLEQIPKVSKASQLALKGLAIAGNMFVSWAIAKGIELAAKAIDNFIHRVEYAKEALEESSESFQSATSDLEDLQEQLSETADRLKELDADGITVIEQSEYDKLVATNKELERTIALKKIEQQANARQAAEDATDLYNKMNGNHVTAPSQMQIDSFIASKESSNILNDINAMTVGLKDARYDINNLLATYSILQDAIKETQAEMDSLVDNNDSASQETLLALQNRISEYEGYLTDTAAYISEVSQNYQEIVDGINSKTEIGIELTQQETAALNNANTALDLITNNFKAMEQELSDNVNRNLSNSLRQLADDHGITDRDEYETLINYTKDFTAEQAELWLKATQRANDAADAIRKYEEALKGTRDSSTPLLSISETVEQLNTQLKPALDSMKSAYQDIFTDEGFKLDEIDILSTCDAIKSKLDEIAKIRPDFDYSAYEDFVRVLSDTESTEGDVEKAFDSLATSITDTALSGTEDFNTMKAALEDLGVANSEMVAFNALINNTESLKESGLDLVEVSRMEADEADNVIEAFAEETVSASNLEKAVNLLKIQKMLCAENSLNTSTDIQNLYMLAQAAGVATDAIQRLMGLNSAYESAMAEGNTLAASAYKGAMAVVRAQVTEQFKHLDADVDFSGLDKAARSAGSAAGDAYVDAFEKELGELDRLKEQGKITEKEYLDQLRVKLCPKVTISVKGVWER